jgi:hypothetical protein
MFKYLGSFVTNTNEVEIEINARIIAGNKRYHAPTFPLYFLQLRGPATALSRKILHDLTIARHFKSFFHMHNKNIYNEN